MRAIRYYGSGDVRLDEVPEPPVGESQVKVKVAWNGICGSDLHSFFKPIPGISPSSTEPHPVTNETLPVTMGHEFSGTIVEIGVAVDPSHLVIGQQVVVEPLLPCQKRTCAQCSSGIRNLCPTCTYIGIGGRGGGLAEYISVDQDLVYSLPPSITLELGALMEPLAVAWHAVKKSNIKAGDKVLVLGGGPIGLLALKVSKVLGASWVGLSEPALKRREIAKDLGADVVYDPTAPGIDVPAKVAEVTGGHGADIVFECAGIQPTLNAALQAVRPRGTIVNVALWETVPSIHMGLLMVKEAIFTSSCSYDRDHPAMLQAVAEGKFNDIDKLITRRIPLEDFVEKGIKALINEKDEHVKILVYPGA